MASQRVNELSIHSEVQSAKHVVALESTLISHGLPWPINLDTALQAEEVVREQGATPATIAILKGVAKIGLTPDEIQFLAQEKGVLKASQRDLGIAMALRKNAATTVAATMKLAHRAGISVFATGGIGGVHRGAEQSGDVSADLIALSQIPVAVVCAGAKSILDLTRTLEMLETLSVPVIGYQTDDFPAFYLQTSGLGVSARADSPEELGSIIRMHWELGGAGILIAQPLPEEEALDEEEWNQVLTQAEADALDKRIQGKAVTPFLLSRIAELTEGRSLRANQALILNNARLAAEVANIL